VEGAPTIEEEGPTTPVHGSHKGHKPVSSSVVMTPKFNENGERQNLTEDEKKNVYSLMITFFFSSMVVNSVVKSLRGVIDGVFRSIQCPVFELTQSQCASDSFQSGC
jgi:hypothetical protein